MTTSDYTGLDIAKQNLQLHRAGRIHDLPNTGAGHCRLLKLLAAQPGAHVVCEAAGGYERDVVAALPAGEGERADALGNSDALKRKLLRVILRTGSNHVYSNHQPNIKDRAIAVPLSRRTGEGLGVRAAAKSNDHSLKSAPGIGSPICARAGSFRDAMERFIHPHFHRLVAIGVAAVSLSFVSFSQAAVTDTNAPATDTNRFGFSGPEVFPVDFDIGGLHVADLDGDGLKDIVVVNNSRSKINLLYNQTGATNLAAKIPAAAKREINQLPPDARFRIDSIASEKRIASLVVADLNSDGRSDLLLVNWDSPTPFRFRLQNFSCEGRNAELKSAVAVRRANSSALAT